MMLLPLYCRKYSTFRGPCNTKYIEGAAKRVGFAARKVVFKINTTIGAPTTTIGALPVRKKPAINILKNT